MENKLKKNIDSLRDERNHIWTFFLLTLGGSMTLFLQANTIIKFIISGIGLFFSLILFSLYLKKAVQIDNFINKMEK